TAELAPSDAVQRARLARTRARVAFTRGRGSGDAPVLVDSVHQFFRVASDLESLDAAMAQQTLLEAVSAAMYAGRYFGADVRRHVTAALSAGAEIDPNQPAGLLLRALTTRISEGSVAGAPL